MRKLNEKDWEYIHESLTSRGFAHLPDVLNKNECQQLIANYNQVDAYRNVILMQRYRFGAGEYKYYSYPLPPIIQTLRESFYISLVPTANIWTENVKLKTAYPESHEKFVSHCHQHGQTRPTPLILKYEKGGYNTLHQDLYGEVFFPFQLVVVLSQKDSDFTGGELVFTEQVPRAQSRATVMNPNQGDAIIFTTNFRPVRGTRGYYRSAMKHGISEVKSGERFALGIIFHDAK